MSDRVEIFEVGPRDGLQNEASLIATSDKIRLVDLLSECGFSRIEVTSFVSPKWVPQMADAAEVLAGITRSPGVSYAALTPNIKGYDRARAANADEIAIFGSASEGFSQKNINCSIAESLDRFRPIAEAARHRDIPVRGYVSCVTDCPYDGPTDPADVARVAEALFAMGCYEISLGDTIGAGRPDSVANMLSAVTDMVPVHRLAGHFHDTGDFALGNIDTAYQHGIRVFDTAIGGLGGCPYAPGAKGNVATEIVVAHMASLGIETGIDTVALDAARDFALKIRGADA